MVTMPACCLPLFSAPLVTRLPSTPEIPALTTHPVRGFKDYFYFRTKKISVWRLGDVHMCLAPTTTTTTKTVTKRRSDGASSLVVLPLPASSSSWEFIVSSLSFPARSLFGPPLYHARERQRRSEIKVKRSLKRARQPSARLLIVSVTVDGQGVNLIVVQFTKLSSGIYTLQRV